jgi:hypothetical protein
MVSFASGVSEQMAHTGGGAFSPPAGLQVRFSYTCNLIDAETPYSVHTRTGFNGQTYELVFSDELKTTGIRQT